MQARTNHALRGNRTNKNFLVSFGRGLDQKLGKISIYRGREAFQEEIHEWSLFWYESC